MNTKEEYKKFIKHGYEVKRQARLETVKLLNEYGPLEFNWVDGNAPSIAYTQFEDDLTDCYITKLYAQGEYVYADLHAYYLGDDCTDVAMVVDECNIDWLDILSWVVNRFL